MTEHLLCNVNLQSSSRQILLDCQSLWVTAVELKETKTTTQTHNPPPHQKLQENPQTHKKIQILFFPSHPIHSDSSKNCVHICQVISRLIKVFLPLTGSFLFNLVSLASPRKTSSIWTTRNLVNNVTSYYFSFERGICFFSKQAILRSIGESLEYRCYEWNIRYYNAVHLYLILQKEVNLPFILCVLFIN